MGRAFYEHWMGDITKNHWQADHVELFRPWVETPTVLLLPEVAESTRRRLIALKSRQTGVTDRTKRLIARFHEKHRATDS